MNPAYLMTLILISLMTFTNATTTNATIYTPNMIVSYIPVEYTTPNGNIGYLIMPSYTYINVSSNDSFNNDSFNTSSFFTELIGFICYIYSYKYIISNAYFIIVNIKSFIKYLETVEPEPKPEPKPEPEPEFTIPTINIKEDIIVDEDEDDGDNNQSIYTTPNNYCMTLFDIDGVKIDDIVYKGSCYIETYDNILFTSNYTPIKFNDITYRQLLIIASLSIIKKNSYNIDASSDINIDTDKTYNGLQVVSIRYS